MYEFLEFCGMGMVASQCVNPLPRRLSCYLFPKSSALYFVGSSSPWGCPQSHRQRYFMMMIACQAVRGLVNHHCIRWTAASHQSVKPFKAKCYALKAMTDRK